MNVGEQLMFLGNRLGNVWVQHIILITNLEDRLMTIFRQNLNGKWMISTLMKWTIGILVLHILL